MEDTKPLDRDEWMTPEYIVDIARVTMGEIDLDPCSTGLANSQVVKATHYYDKLSDGLNQRWQGRVFMNPPYSRGNIEKFVIKLIASYEEGLVYEAVTIVNNATETRWFHHLLRVASAVGLLDHRVHFLGTDMQPVRQTRQGQVMFYLGDYPFRFEEQMFAYGRTLRR